MKNSLAKTLFSLLLMVISASAISQSAEWKHYEYKDINLQFDLPADYEFTYPDDGTLSFKGHNNLTTMYFNRVDKALYTEEDRKTELYAQAGYIYDGTEDPNFHADKALSGYYVAMTMIITRDTEELAIASLFSDPKNNRLNFFVYATVGENATLDSPSYIQARDILMKIKPIEKQ
jgi:hypothetical protein